MPNLSSDRNMGFSAFLTWTAVWVAILHQLHQVTAFPLHAAALNDIPTYSGEYFFFRISSSRLRRRLVVLSQKYRASSR